MYKIELFFCQLNSLNKKLEAPKKSFSPKIAEEFIKIPSPQFDLFETSVADLSSPNGGFSNVISLNKEKEKRNVALRDSIILGELLIRNKCFFAAGMTLYHFGIITVAHFKKMRADEIADFCSFSLTKAYDFINFVDEQLGTVREPHKYVRGVIVASIAAPPPAQNR